MNAGALGATQSVVAIGEMRQFARDDVHFVAQDGTEWLKTGFVTQDFESFPTAYLHKTLFFENYATPKKVVGAYSKELGMWVMLSTNQYSPNNVFISRNDCKTHTAITASLNILAKDVIWSSHHHKFFAIGQTNFILESSDGENWTSVETTLSSNAHCITEGKNGRLIVSYHNYIAYSDDGGATLVTSSTLGLSSFGIYTLLNAGTFGIYAFTNSGILRSRDNGETFLKVSTMQRQAAVYSERLGAIVCSGTYVVTHCIDGDNFFDVSGTPGGQKLSFSNIIENGTDFFASSSSHVFHSQDGVNFVVKDGASSSVKLVTSDNAIVSFGANDTYVSQLWYKYIGWAESLPSTYVRIK
ncbi:TPA: hypothetical protein ACGUVO_002538 [Vibrio vulnificus]